MYGSLLAIYYDDKIVKKKGCIAESFLQCLGSGFFPGPDQTFFPESGSGSAKNPDPIRKNPDPDT